MESFIYFLGFIFGIILFFVAAAGIQTKKTSITIFSLSLMAAMLAGLYYFEIIATR